MSYNLSDFVFIGSSSKTSATSNESSTFERNKRIDEEERKKREDEEIRRKRSNDDFAMMSIINSCLL